jgi:hypothetical protein
MMPPLASGAPLFQPFGLIIRKVAECHFCKPSAYYNREVVAKGDASLTGDYEKLLNNFIDSLT